MNWKSAILIGALAWVIIFFEVSILMFGFGLQTGATYYTIHYIFSAILVILLSIWYFNGKNVKANWKEGLLTGIIFVVTGIILDAIITVPLFIKSYSFFVNWMLLVGYLEGIILASIVGAMKE